MKLTSFSGKRGKGPTETGAKIVILSTHAVVGAAIATLMPDHPALAFVSGIASHFAIDAIPHWDYPLRSISIKPSTGPALTLNWALFQDLGLITLDACVGLAVALYLYASPAAAMTVLLGALGAMLPDPLQLAHKLYPREPLRTLQRFHVWIHSKQKLEWPIGVTSQLSFVLLVIAGLAALRALLA
jgi:hypothetical protein